MSRTPTGARPSRGRFRASLNLPRGPPTWGPLGAFHVTPQTWSSHTTLAAVEGNDVATAIPSLDDATASAQRKERTCALFRRFQKRKSAPAHYSIVFQNKERTCALFRHFRLSATALCNCTRVRYCACSFLRVWVHLDMLATRTRFACSGCVVRALSRATTPRAELPGGSKHHVCHDRAQPGQDTMLAKCSLDLHF